MKLQEDIIGLTSFVGDKYWYFVDDKVRRKGHLYFSNQDVPAFSIQVKKEEVVKFEKPFNAITTSGLMSRLTMFYANGFAQFTFPGSKTQNVNFHPGYVVHQLFSKETIPFETLNLRGSIPGINYWFGDNLLDFDETERSFKQKKDLYYDMDINKFMKVKLKIEFEKKGYSNNEFVATHKSYVQLDFTDKISYSLAIIRFKLLEDFFNFIFPEATDQYHFQSRRERPGQKYDAVCDIIATRHQNDRSVKRDNDYSILFGFSDVSDPSVVIRGWVNNYYKFERVWESLKYLKISNLSEEARFLNLVGAIENVHRSYFEKVDADQKKQHKDRLKNIASRLDDPADKAMIKIRLKNAYEKTLTERLHQINEMVSAFGIKKLSNEQESKIVATRNDRIHSLKTDTQKLLSDGEMYDINRILAMQVKVILLAIIGVTTEELKKITSKSNHFKSYYRD